jgi:ABC-2 type transport system ATP-binding protein
VNRENIVQVRGLKKKYSDGTYAVKSISFNVRKGEIFGFLGPNGAGKTTTINMLTTLLPPTGGTLKVAGYDVRKSPNEVRKKIGVVFQEPALDGKLTALENLDFHARLYGMKKEEREKRIKQVLALVDLEKSAKKLVELFSGGMKRRLEIARGLMHNPAILFLDEPTLGLDVQTRRKVWEYIIRVKNEENTTIFLTTHYMEEAEKICDRIAIIDDGKIIKSGSPAKLIDDMCEGVVSVKTSDKIRPMKNASEMKKVNGTTLIKVNDSSKINQIVKEVLGRYSVDEINIHRPSLEDLFLNLTGKTIREEPVKRRGPW